MGAIYSLLISLVGAIYNLVATVFELFSMLSKVTTIDKNVYGNIIENFYLLIGVVMLFIIAFYLLKAMINPDDNKETSNGGKIVKNFITSVIILLILPTIFNFAFSFQFAIVNYNTIGKMFGYNNSADTMASAGNSMANSVFTAFFTPSRQQCAKEDKEDDFDECAKTITSGGDDLNTVISEVNKSGYFTSYSKFGDNVANNEIDFNFLIALFGGLYLVYVIFSFCLDLGVRLVKLVFYQIIAPIPVFLRVVPEGKLSNTFNDWVKITITCYLEVFIRLFIIFFGVYLISAFTSNEGLGSFLNVGSGFLGLMAKVIIILGVITFIKQAPKLIGDIFGFDSSNMKLGLREKLAAGGLFAASAAVGGAFTSGSKNLTAKFKENRKAGKGRLASAGLALTTGAGSVLAGALSGGIRSGRAGWNAKSFKDMKAAASSGATAAVNARNKRANYRAAHGGLLGSLNGHITDLAHSAKNYFLDESIEGLTRESNSMGEITSRYDTFNDTIENLLEKEQAKGTGSVFIAGGTGGFNLTNYDAFDTEAQNLATVRSQFNAGTATAAQLRQANSAYIHARDAVRDELMNMALKGSNSTDYKNLSDKGRAALKDSLVNAESLQATILANANTKVVQDIMGANGNNALSKIINGTSLNVNDFIHNNSKLKDVAKVAQGAADIKIAEMNKEQAAKGDNK